MKYRLGDLVQIKYGKDHKKLNAGNIPVYGTGGLMRRVNDFIYDGDSVLIPRKGSLNNVMYVTNKFWTVDTMFWTKIDKNKILPKYLYYCLSKIDLSTFNVGSAVPSLTIKILNEITLEVPSLQIQNEIISKIKPIEDKIRLNNKINDNLIAISKAKWLDLLSSTSTTEVVMNKIAKITMGQSPKSSTYNTNNEGLPLLNGATDFRENINPQRWTSDPKRVVYPNSYIFGVRATIGLTTKVYQKYAIGRGTGAATPINIIYDEFLYFYLEDLFKFYSQTGSGSVYINISKKEFENYKIDVPKISFIEQFHSEINPLFNQIKNNKLQNITLLQIKKDMLNKYFQ